MPKFSVHALPDDTKSVEMDVDHYIQIDEGDFEGVQFTFGKIQFLGQDDEGQGRIIFDYDLVSVPEHMKFSTTADLTEDSLEEIRVQLEALLGDIMQQILSDITLPESGEQNEIGNADTESTPS